MRFASMLLVSALAIGVFAATADAQISASGVVNLTSINGSGPGQTFTYSITLTNNSAESIDSFWYAWLPPDNVYDFLKSTPTGETSPAGWGATVEGQHVGIDGNSIRWDTSTSPLTTGNQLTFGFTTPDSPKIVTGTAPPYGYPVGYSYVYNGVPEASDFGFLTVATGTVPEPATLSLLAAGAVFFVRRPRRA